MKMSQESNIKNYSRMLVCFVCLFFCLLVKGTSALFRLLMPRIFQIKHMRLVENDLKYTSC